MCGRYTVSNPGEVLPELLGSDSFPKLQARFNVAPTQQAPVVVAGEDGSRRVVEMRWGLVPYWAREMSIGNRMINARSETAMEKPAFKESFAGRRCLIAADGFYEWKRVVGGKRPYLIQLDGGAPMAFAGLYDRWRQPEGAVLESFTILTTEPNDTMRPIHDRMPVILDRRGRTTWLDVSQSLDSLQELMLPWTCSALETSLVSDLVNSPANDSLECMTQAGAPAQGTLF